ncbi:unnamed protein product [Rhizophagus irregularis]|nr:unnamed protein product [Rhizophagus irregularis]
MENQESGNPTSTTDYDDLGDLVYYDDDGGREKSTERAPKGTSQESNLSNNMEEDLEFDDDDLFEEACDKCSEVISKVPLLRLNASVSKPVVLLPCRHKTHFECISNKSKLCPKCPSIDDLEKEGYYISPTFDEASKKRKRKDDSRKSSRGTKAQTIIRELSIRPASEVSIGTLPEDSDMREVSNQFHKLYYEIDDAEKNGDRANRDLVSFYFRFGKALSERLAILLQSNPPQTAHTKLNKEVKEKLPKNANNGMVRKRTDTARKIYDIFSAIGEDKIRRIKSFTAYSFLDLTRSEVAYIVKNFEE